MALRVADLVAQPDLRLQVLAGAAGLSRSVTWAHASDLPQPWDWLAGGELLMKNGRSLPRSARAQTAFLEGLATAELSALVIGSDPETPALSPRARVLADDVRVPVLEVPYSMSFLVLSRRVADASLDEEASRIARTGRIWAAIRAAVGSGAPGLLLRRLEEELGYRVWVLDTATAATVLPSRRPPDAGLVKDLHGALKQRNGHIPGVLHLPDRGRRSAVAVEIPYEEPTVLVAERDDGHSFDVSLLHHAATAAGVEVAHEALRADFASQMASTVLADLLLGSPSGPQTGTQLEAAGVGRGGGRVLAVDDPGPDQLRRLGIALRRRGVPHLLVNQGGLLWVLTAAGSDAAVVEVVLERLGPHTAVGLSKPLDGSPVTGLTAAASEAQWARAAAEKTGGGASAYGAASPLPGLLDPAQALSFVERVLGPLLAYDDQQSTDLVHSLEVFLAERRSWSRTATRLSVHRQTVVYRMQRVEAITGRDLSETGDIAELWLAVRAREIISAEERTDA